VGLTTPTLRGLGAVSELGSSAINASHSFQSHFSKPAPMWGMSAVFYNRIALFLIFAPGRVPERSVGARTAAPVSSKLTLGCVVLGRFARLEEISTAVSYKKRQDILKFDVLAIDRPGIRIYWRVPNPICRWNLHFATIM